MHISCGFINTAGYISTYVLLKKRAEGNREKFGLFPRMKAACSQDVSQSALQGCQQIFNLFKPKDFKVRNTTSSLSLIRELRS